MGGSRRAKKELCGEESRYEVDGKYEVDVKREGGRRGEREGCIRVSDDTTIR